MHYTVHNHFRTRLCVFSSSCCTGSRAYLMIDEAMLHPRRINRWFAVPVECGTIVNDTIAKTSSTTKSSFLFMWCPKLNSCYKFFFFIQMPEIDWGVRKAKPGKRNNMAPNEGQSIHEKHKAQACVLMGNGTKRLCCRIWNVDHEILCFGIK